MSAKDARTSKRKAEREVAELAQLARAKSFSKAIRTKAAQNAWSDVVRAKAGNRAAANALLRDASKRGVDSFHETLFLESVDGLGAFEAFQAVERRLAALDEKVERKFSCTDFKCPKCGKRECNWIELQTRSADEPASVYALCVCGNRWRAA